MQVKPQTVYLSMDPNAGQSTQKSGGYLSTDPKAGDDAKPPQEPEQAASIPEQIGQSFANYGRGLWNIVNPVAIVKAMAKPIETGKAMLEAQGNQWTEAQSARERGDYGQMAEHFAAYLVPVLGPAADHIIQLVREGKVDEATGELTGLGMPWASKFLKGARVPGMGGPANALEAEAVRFGQDRGIPVDAATATGNRAVRATQFLADRTATGSVNAERAGQAQAAQLSRVGRELSAEAYPKGAVSPESAGRSVATAVEDQIRSYQDLADAAYSKVRELESDPANTRTITTGKRSVDTGIMDAQGNKITRAEPITETMGMPVDLRTAKRALRPLYDQLKRQYSTTQAEASPGLKALENIINGPDYAPLSQVDADLSAIKSIARSDMPAGAKTPSQGLASQGVQQMERAVQTTVNQFKGAREALQAGREAVKGKFEALDTWDAIKNEPVKAFRQAIERGDAGIDQLRAVQRQAPDALPKLARAYLDDLMDRATAGGGFTGAKGIASEWNKLGAQTKKMLFTDPLYVRDLDNFFRLAERMAENPNPSGTGNVLSMGAQGALLWSEPVTGAVTQLTGYALSKLMHSPRGVRILTKGLTVPLSNRSAAIATVTELAKASADAGVPMQALGYAQTGTPQGTTKR